jgi:hypothetical protein
MHATADTLVVKFLRRAGRRVMRGVSWLLYVSENFQNNMSP